VGLNGNAYRFGSAANLNRDSDFNAQTRRAARVAVPLTELDWSASANFTYVPMYGKFAGFGDFIFHYDAYVVGGVGVLSDRPIAVIDPDNRTFESKINLAFNAGLGLRIFFNRWFAANLEVRDYIFFDKLENTTIAVDPNQARNPDTWYDDKSRLTNNVQAQIGFSVFLPFSWEYRLPK
jgi:outer membrane beta-barrel protein